MSGPKCGAVAVSGAGAGAAVSLASVAAVALPVAAVALVGYGIYKGSQATNRAMEEHKKHKGDMLAEITSRERPVLSSIANGLTRWQNEKRTFDAVRQKTENELAKLRVNTGMPQTKKDAEETYQKASALLAEAETLHQDFQTAQNKATGQFSEARRVSGSSQRTVRKIVSSGCEAGDRAVGAINQSVENMRRASILLEETILIIQQKGAEERRLEILRQDAQSNVALAKSEITAESVAIIADWMGDEAVQMLNAHLKKAKQSLAAEQYEESSLRAQESVAMYRKFYETSIQTKQQFENREIITDAIVDALNELQYDEPDVNYEPKANSENALLGNLTIFAKSKGETGDMRLVIGLDGKLDLDTDVPEGKEGECHRLLTDLQTKVSDVVDFSIIDWGRAKNYRPEERGGIPKQTVRVQEQVKQRRL